MFPALIAAILIPLGGANQINLQIESGGVHLIAAAGIRTISVRTITSGSAQPRVDVTRVGNSTISLALTGHAGIRLPFALGPASKIGYEITYPANVRIEASNLSGDVTIDNERARVDVQTNSGTIVANNAHGDIDLAADSGSIDVTLAPDWKGSSIRMQSGGGTLSLSVPPEFRAHIDADTDDGKLRNALAGARSNARRPFVWLYTVKGNVSITASKT
jgi:hypothetical protein